MARDVRTDLQTAIICEVITGRCHEDCVIPSLKISQCVAFQCALPEETQGRTEQVVRRFHPYPNTRLKIISLNSVNYLIYVMVKCGVLFEVRTEFLNNI
jgi:hypothetical protein